MLRLLAILVFFLVIISVIRGIVKTVISFWAGLSGSKASPFASRGTGATDNGQHLSLVQDPVCGTYVATETSFKKIVKGKVVHFCSEACKDQYRG